MPMNDLTSLPTLKTWLGIASDGDDALLAGLIADISVAILTDLGRATVRPAVYTEVRDGGGETSLLLRQWPVNQLLSVRIDGRDVAIAGRTQPGRARVYAATLDAVDLAPPGGMQRLSMTSGALPRGLQNVTVCYRAGYEVAAETATVPASAPYVITAAAPYGAWLSDGAVTDAAGVALQAGAAPAPGVYTAASGTYSFAAQDAGSAVVLRYGYVPADLARACCEWAADRYAARSRIGQSSKTLGGQETTAFIVKAMPDFVSRLLQPYRRVVAP